MMMKWVEENTSRQEYNKTKQSSAGKKEKREIEQFKSETQKEMQVKAEK